ncbi:MAG: C1 family peptidase [Chitinophagales bacterium]
MKNKFLVTAIALCVSVSTFAQLGTGLLEDPSQKKNFSDKEPGTHGYGTTIPSSYSMQMFTPFIKSQGAYGTCAAWSAAYSAYTTQYAKKMGLTDRNLITALAFCPYYVYNKANGDNACEAGTSLETILIFMRDYGVKRFYMPIIGCGTAINALMDDDASHYTIKDAYYLYDPPGYPTDRSAAAVSDFLLNKPKPDIQKIKGTLADGYPVVFGGYVANSFMNASGSSLWEPTAEERANPGQAVIDNQGMHQQHAMCIVGYDDNKFGGAFLVMNSWSTLWGDNGYIWIKYDDWALFNYKAFWLDIGTTSLELLVDNGCASGDCNEGYGVYKFSNGQRYEGHFKGGTRNGYGIYTWPDGSAYAGEWLNDKRHGEAVIYLTNGSNGTCTYADDVQVTGYGDWVYNNGDKYTGNLSSNYIRNGYGTYTFSNGRKYTGANVDDKFSGLGKMQWTNGDIYIGEVE